MHRWEREMGDRDAISSFFSASSQLMSLWEEKKNSFTHKTVLEINVWQKKNSPQQLMKLLWTVPNRKTVLEISVWQKKQSTTTHEAVVNCNEQKNCFRNKCLAKRKKQPTTAHEAVRPSKALKNLVERCNEYQAVGKKSKTMCFLTIECWILLSAEGARTPLASRF